jgi:hypothetical protein
MKVVYEGCVKVVSAEPLACHTCIVPTPAPTAAVASFGIGAMVVIDFTLARVELSHARLKYMQAKSQLKSTSASFTLAVNVLAQCTNRTSNVLHNVLAKLSV